MADNCLCNSLHVSLYNGGQYYKIKTEATTPYKNGLQGIDEFTLELIFRFTRRPIAVTRSAQFSHFGFQSLESHLSIPVSRTSLPTHLMRSLDYHSTRPSTALMPPFDDLEWTRGKIIKMPASFRTVRTDANDHNENTTARAELLNKEEAESPNDGIHPEMEQTERTTISKGKPQLDNVVPSYIESNQWLLHRYRTQ